MKIESFLFWTAVAGDLVLFFYAGKHAFRAIKLFRGDLAKSLRNASAACGLGGLAMLLPWSLWAGESVVGEVALVICLLLPPLVIAWEPLYRRFRAKAILSSYCGLLCGLMLIGPFLVGKGTSIAQVLFSAIFLTVAVLILKDGRRKPIEQRKPTVAWMVVNGLWDQLAKEGLPADEIERLKRLTPEERARLMAEIMRPVFTYNHPRVEDFGPRGKYGPLDLSLYNPWDD